MFILKSTYQEQIHNSQIVYKSSDHGLTILQTSIHKPHLSGRNCGSKIQHGGGIGRNL
jgi:hypothetical protein